MLNYICRYMLTKQHIEGTKCQLNCCYAVVKWIYLLTFPIFCGIYKLSFFHSDIIREDLAMARPKADKTESLKRYGALNPHPQKVAEVTFSDSKLDFFDPRDLVQVKYEMLRAVEKEGRSVKHASQAFGFSRPAFYQAQAQFKRDGVTGLVKKRPGPKSAHKLTADILAFIEEKIEEDKPLRARKLAPLIKEQFGKYVHPRSIERAVARRKKKRK
jgi:transposase